MWIDRRVDGVLVFWCFGLLVVFGFWWFFGNLLSARVRASASGVNLSCTELN